MTYSVMQSLKLKLEVLGYALITDNAERIAAKIKSILLDLIISPAHFTNQFKQVTEMTPTTFKNLNS